MRFRRVRKPFDKFGLYERSVQRPDFDIDFITRVYATEHARVPLVLREDFCGTAFISAEWIKSNPRRTAIGLDLDATTLAWGRKWNVEPLGDEARRLTLLQKDVREVFSPKADVTIAFNFSYCVFMTRPELVDYFRRARRGLKKGGAFMLDGYSGPDSLNPGDEVRNYAKFTYTWDQRPMDAISGRAMRYIHFKMKGQRKEMTRAFSYDWRIWMITELVDALTEAGFSRVDVHDEKKSGYRLVKRAEWKDAFIPIVVAWA
ncbi:MAG: class I SAM-dependent methyltransferase [Acidobacteriota bacterium]|nr:class I SAM-dependent methyltransferase [Acidobacteriota bacterium]